MIQKQKTKLKELYPKFIKAKNFFIKMDVKIYQLIIPIILAFIASALDGLSISLLVPLIKGVIDRDFSFLEDVPILNNLLDLFPSIFSSPDFSSFIFILSLIFSATLLKQVILYINTLIIGYRTRKITHNVRKIIFNRYMNFGKKFFDKNNTGYLQMVLMGHTQIISDLVNSITDLINWFTQITIYFILMMIISIKMTLVLLIFFPVYKYSLEWIIKKIKKTSKFAIEAGKNLNKKVFNVLSCIPLIKIYNNEEKEKEKFSQMSQETIKWDFSMQKKMALIGPIRNTISLITISILVLIMTYLALKTGSGGLSFFIVYFYLFKKINDMMGGFSNFKSRFAQQSATLEELKKMLDNKDKFLISSGSKEFKGLKNKIEFKNLNFFYDKEVPVLKNINFTVEKGKITAIVGHTGSGKTTIVNLLLGLYEVNPKSIFIDGIDIKEFDIKSLRKHMSVVTQEIFLFNDTVRKNIIYGSKRKVEDKEIIKVLKEARLDDFVKRLPEGINTFIGDRGVKLSGGEKQRISIARALLKGSEIIILDEATSSLDSTTEKLIQDAINSAIKERTGIVIAHRLSTIKNADKIIVLENGKVIEQGKLKDLIAKKRKFYEYWKEQKFD